MVIPNCDYSNVNDTLRSVCEKRIRTAIQLNRLHLSTVFYVKLVLGGISVIGIIPLFSADVDLVLYSYCQGVLRTGKQKVYLYPENQFRWGIGCGWDMRVQSVGSVGISLLNEPVRWVFHPTTIEDKRPLNEDDIQVLNHLRDLKEGLERE